MSQASFQERTRYRNCFLALNVISGEYYILTSPRLEVGEDRDTRKRVKRRTERIRKEEEEKREMENKNTNTKHRNQKIVFSLDLG